MNQKISSRAYLVWGLAACFFFAEYFARVAPSVMALQLARDFHINALALGSLSAFFYYAYVGMQLPVGTLVDHYGPHKLLTLMAGICGLACLLFASSHALWVADIARFLMGFAAAFAFVGALKLAANWFPQSRFGMMAGATQALGMVGAAVGEGPVGFLVEHSGWRYSMVCIGIFLIILALLIGFIVSDNPKVPNWPEERTNHLNSTFKNLWCSLITVLSTWQCWVNGVFVGFLYAPTAAFAELWGASYLHTTYHLSMATGGTMIGGIFIGFAISSPLAGWLSDRIQRRKPIMLLSALCSLILMSVILYVPHIPTWGIAILLFLYGASNVAVATSYAVACEQVPSNAAATSMSFANMASVIIGALLQPVIGALLQTGWNHVMKNGVPVYTTQDFHHALVTLPLCIVVSLIAWCFLKESYHKVS
jgi:MFS family permease